MQPIFTEFINFMKDKGYNVPITEGTYWLDNGFIKAYTPDGVLHKLYKYKVFDDLSISVTKYKEYIDADFETWTETAERLSDDINRKVEESLKAIKHTLGIFKDMDKWVLTSTGKDSMVVLDLVQKVIPDVNVMFNNTSLDVADTYKMVKSHPDWIITNQRLVSISGLSSRCLFLQDSQGLVVVSSKKVQVYLTSKNITQIGYYNSWVSEMKNLMRDRTGDLLNIIQSGIIQTG